MAFGQYLGYIVGAIGAVVGGVIGFYSGGPAGAAYGATLGFSIGSLVGGISGQVFWPERTELNLAPPPQPHETRLQFSSWGMPIPMQYGSGRMAGNIIYMSDIKETISRSKHRQDGVRYYEMTKTYTATFVVAFCEGPVEGIARVWVNNKIFADFRNVVDYPPGYVGYEQGNIVISLERASGYMNRYFGSVMQNHDTFLASLLGAAETPAYRGICYIVFKDFPVGEFSGVPQIQIETGQIPHGIWLEKFPKGTDDTWGYATANADQSIIYAWSTDYALGNNLLYRSFDFGLNWEYVRSAKYWYRMVTNSDATKLVIVSADQTYGNLYLSTDYGSTVTSIAPAAGMWACAAISPDGNVIVAGYGTYTPGGKLYVSFNSGASWTEIKPAGNTIKQWYQCACSDDGKIIMAAESNKLYVSSDFGVTWNLRITAGDLCMGMSCNSDGSVQYAAFGNYNRIYRSMDFGTTWVQKNPSGNVDRSWRSPVVCDASGAKVAVAESAGRLYYSINYGENWSPSDPGAISPFWASIDMGLNGDLVICALYLNGGIFTWRY